MHTDTWGTRKGRVMPCDAYMRFSILWHMIDCSMNYFSSILLFQMRKEHIGT